MALTPEQLEKRKRINKKIILFVFTPLALIMATLWILSPSKRRDRASDGRITSKKISKNLFRDDWPFTVSDGLLKCENNCILFIHAGKVYGVNGLAKSMYKGHKNYEDISLILQDDPLLGDNFKKDIGPILEAGKALCK